MLKKTDGLFREIFYEVAKEYPEIATEDFYVDATAMYLITQPESFEVIVTTNLFGDILSDEGAGLVGGLGLIPSANIGVQQLDDATLDQALLKMRQRFVAVEVCAAHQINEPLALHKEIVILAANGGIVKALILLDLLHRKLGFKYRYGG